PVAGQHEVLVSALVGTEPVRIASRRALHVAVGGVDVGKAELGVDRAAAYVPVPATEQVPAKRTACRRPGQQVREPLFDELDGVGAYLIPMLGHVITRGRTGRPRRLQRAAEVGDRARP